MGNYLEEDKCLRCGTPLIDLNAKWHMCTVCIKQTEEDFKKFRQRKKEDEGSPNRKKMWIQMLGRKRKLEMKEVLGK